MDFLILICSLFTLIVTINAGPTDDHPHMQNLSGLCSDLKESITEGSFVARKKILDECAVSKLQISLSILIQFLIIVTKLRLNHLRLNKVRPWKNVEPNYPWKLQLMWKKFVPI